MGFTTVEARDFAELPASIGGPDSLARPKGDQQNDSIVICSAPRVVAHHHAVTGSKRFKRIRRCWWRWRTRG
eukprot:4088199-Prymnesium_polylepis.2